MTPAELLAECRKLDIVFKLDGNGGLKIDAPSGVLVPGLLARLKKNKAALLALIEAEQVSAPKPVPPAIRAGYTGVDPDWWRDAMRMFDRRAYLSVANGDIPTRSAGSCPKCGATATTDTEIHAGRSIRRDCAKCRHFIAFVRWYDVDRFSLTERN